MHGRLFFAFITRPKQAVGTGNGLWALSGAVTSSSCFLLSAFRSCPLKLKHIKVYQGSQVQPRAPSAIMAQEDRHPRQKGTKCTLRGREKDVPCPPVPLPAWLPPSGGWCGTWRHWHGWWWWLSCRLESLWEVGWGPGCHPASGLRVCPWR